MNGKCPQCEAMVTRLDLRTLNASTSDGSSWKSVTFNCPMCHAVLGAQINPTTLKSDIVNETVREIVKALGR